MYSYYFNYNFIMDLKEQIRVLQLIKDAGNFCQSNLGYSKKTLYIYNRFWKNLFRLMLDTGIPKFEEQSYDILLEKINYNRSGKKGLNVTWHRPTDKYYLNRCLKMLCQFQDSHTIVSRFLAEKEENVWPEPINSQIRDFIDYLVLKLRRNKVTANAYKYSLSFFVKYLIDNGVYSFEHLDIITIINYIRNITPKSQVTPTLQIGHLRGLSRYLYEQDIINYDLSAQIPRSKRISQPKLPSVYSQEEIMKLLSSNLRITPIEKRDYALLLLTVRLGLRASDVCNLTFDNINWRENKIEIIQSKTGNPIVLPLLADVGNAIIDYLKNGRPKIDSKIIFLKERFPYEMNRPCFEYIVAKAFRRAGISTRGKHHGPHSLRHSLSARLLEEQTGMPVITEILGHEKAETTKYYMRIDIKSMERCLIEFPKVSKTFYKQLLKQYERFIF